MVEKTSQAIAKGAAVLGKQRTYHEVVDYLDQHWAVAEQPTLERMKKLDQAFGFLSQKINTIFIGGLSGKSLTAHFATRLLKEEGLKVGSFFSPHFLNYNERFAVNAETITNKLFTEVGNEVISIAEELSINANSLELLTMMSLVYFEQQEVDVAIMEISKGGTFNPANICHAKVVSITRATPEEATSDAALKLCINELFGVVKTGTYVVSGDQNKASLQLMQELTRAQRGFWAMPIRKLAPLSYPFEQLHGRCATLAERVAVMYMEKVVMANETIVNDSLLIKQKGQRGRPSIEAKKKAEMHPRRTIEQFWKDTINELPGRFQLLDKEKPSLLLDNASNLDALKNLLLGIRLLHYQRPLKGLTIIMSGNKSLYTEDLLKTLRHFFKKTSGQMLICPINNPVAGSNDVESWDAEAVANDLKNIKVKARACQNFEEAFDIARKSVDDRNGLVVITGSRSIIHDYWHYKGIKKF